MKIVQINRVARLVALLAVFFGADVFSMKMSPAGQRSARQIMGKLKRDQIKKALIAANWSQDKIKEFRQKRDPLTKSRMQPKGKLVYGVDYTGSGEETPAEKFFNDMLIEHYAQKIYAALETVPVDERAAWGLELEYILSLGLTDYLKNGVERYKRGQLSVKRFAEDGSEIGIYGTKNKALKRVKAETNGFATIPFDDTSVPMTPVDCFKSL